MILVILVCTVITVVYIFFKINYQYWIKRGIPGPKPRFLVGNLGPSFLLKKHPTQVFTDIYNEFDDVPVVGFYKATTPALLVRDPELIKEITIKSFTNFHDNDIEVDKNVDPLFGRNPFVLRGDEWKIVRTQLTPGFTSGKMKWLYPHIVENSEQLVRYITNQLQVLNGEGYEAKELCTRFTLNNVGSCAFGVNAKCFEEENSEFRQIAHDFLSPGSMTLIKIFIVTIFPIVTKFVSIRFAPEKVERKLVNLVTETLKYREENNIVRNDFLHIMSQLKKTCKDYEFTDVDVTAHAAGFFADGYETSSIVMSFVLFALANNQKVQSNLREEVVKHFEENSNKLPYEALQSMTYLDAVFNETLRMYPPVFALQKLCTQSHTYDMSKNSDNATQSVLIEKGISVILPLYGMQNDPKYFENPKCFNPARFLGNNKENIRKCTFMPFGEGPRSCLGQRFGTLQVKAGVAHIIKNYELCVNKKTKIPLKFDPLFFMTSPIGGLWIDFKKIA